MFFMVMYTCVTMLYDIFSFVHIINGSKNLHGTNSTSKEFTLDTTEENLKKREKVDG